MTKQYQALIFVWGTAAGLSWFAYRMHPAAEWMILSGGAALFLLFGILILVLKDHPPIRTATPQAQEALKNIIASQAEPYHEKEVPLEARDIAVLERDLRWAYLGIFLAVIAAIVFFGADYFFPASSMSHVMSKLGSGFFGGGALLVSLITLLHRKSRSKRIRKAGTKTVIRGIVTGRRVADTRSAWNDARYDEIHSRQGEVNHYLQLGNKEFSVGFKYFSQTTEGDAVEIHYVRDPLNKPLVLHFYLLENEVTKI